MPGRQGASGDYRYGFNGKEMDNDFKDATGTIYDYGFRIYDSRIAKFLSVDPLTGEYPWYTPYQFAGNTPIWAIDLDGLEPKCTNESSLWYGEPLDLADGQDDAIYNDENGTPFMWSQERQNWTEVLTETVATAPRIQKKRNFVFKYGQPLTLFGHTFENSYSTYYDGPRGLGERGGGKVLVNVFAVVGTLGTLSSVTTLGELYSVLIGHAGKQILIKSTSEAIRNISIDVVNQMIVNGKPIGEVDWANALSSGLIKNKVLKNLLSSIVDLDINDGLKQKEMASIVSEFFIRQLTDKALEHVNASGTIDKVGLDAHKKFIREKAEEIKKEILGF